MNFCASVKHHRRCVGIAWGAHLLFGGPQVIPHTCSPPPPQEVGWGGGDGMGVRPPPVLTGPEALATTRNHCASLPGCLPRWTEGYRPPQTVGDPGVVKPDTPWALVPVTAALPSVFRTQRMRLADELTSPRGSRNPAHPVIATATVGNMRADRCYASPAGAETCTPYLPGHRQWPKATSTQKDRCGSRSSSPMGPHPIGSNGRGGMRWVMTEGVPQCNSLHRSTSTRLLLGCLGGV